MLPGRESAAGGPGQLAGSRNAGHGQAREGGPRDLRKARFVVNTSRDARRTAGHTPAKGGRVLSIAMIVIVYVAAPVAAYSLLRS